MVRRAVALFVLLLATVASANELTVDKRTLQADDSLTITLILDGAFTSTDNPRLPLDNLVLDGSPSVSTEFNWINGVTSRRKVFRYTAHAKGGGAAQVGPVVLTDANGATVTLPAIPIVVMPDVVAGSNDPARMMRELIATGRDPIFVIAQADASNVFEGEEVIVTWTLYAGVSIQQYSLGDIPKLDDFWTEELDVRNDRPEDVVLGGIEAQKVTLRRAALFPLHSGTLTIGPLGVRAAVMKRTTSGDPFGLFEGVMSDVHRRSAPLTIIARPLPAGPPVATVGRIVNLQCNPPSQKSGGPIVFDIKVSGRANLRAIQPPAWDSKIDGEVQIVDRGVAKVFSVDYDAWMTRQWRYLIFPTKTGEFTLPGLSMTVLTPAGERKTLRCEAKTLDVSASSSAGLAPPPTQKIRSFAWLQPTAIIAAALVVGMLFVPKMRRQRRMHREIERLLRDTPAATRESVEAMLVTRGIDPLALLREGSDRGDAFRAFRSLIDASEHDRILATRREIGHRVRDLLVALQFPDADHQAADAPAVHDRGRA